jgi:two-component system NtrC family sensor kinase
MDVRLLLIALQYPPALVGLRRGAAGKPVLYSIRAKLIISFLGVSLLVGVVSLFVGGQLLYKSVLHEAKRRITLDLNAAREIYHSRIGNIATALSIASLDNDFVTALRSGDRTAVAGKLRRISRATDLDFVGFADREGKTLYRTGSAGTEKSPGGDNPLVSHVLRSGTAVSGTVILGRDFLLAENPALAEQARIPIVPTPRAAPRDEVVEERGMCLGAGVPLNAGGELVGVLYGGVLLNRNNTIVDRVRETVFQNEVYEGRSIGTATVFFMDLRISTNVLTPEGERAIGTRVSEEVRDRVLIDGTPWTDRAFVVSDWYITAYEPISDIEGKRVGILYVGVLEEKYMRMRRKLLSVFILITVAGLVVAVGLGYFLTTRIVQPVKELIGASEEVIHGNLKPAIGPAAKNEIGILQKNFLEMLSSLRERDRRQRAESEQRLLQSEKQAGIGRLAAGVAHEINNPLTGVLTFTHMLLRRTDIDSEMRRDLETIAGETERVRKIVKGLLDFSRQTALEMEPVDINKLVKTTLGLVENQALVKGITLRFNPKEWLPVRTVDRNQLQSVILNMVINAFDATKPGGTVEVSTDLTVSASGAKRKGIEITISDTGCGIPAENLDKLFDPFFSTKDVGEGTGLGLSVSYGIVERHGGTIRVRSGVDRGSSFTISLPLEKSEGAVDEGERE